MVSWECICPRTTLGRGLYMEFAKAESLSYVCANGRLPVAVTVGLNDSGSTTTPLCVDLDGTLIYSDLLLESLLLLIKSSPFSLFLIPFWLFRGRAVLKAEVAARVALNPAALPYDNELINWLQSERDTGRSLWLCTAANERLASSIGAHVGLFDGVLASDGQWNLADDLKAARLVESFGERCFDYCGNEQGDLLVWKHARVAIVVHGSDQLEQRASRIAPVVRTFPPRGNTFWAAMRALRPHQWAKNALVLIPLLAAHRAAEPAAAAAAILATIVFCLCASSVYIVNDLLDLEADRSHARKCKRPFAAGDLSILFGVMMAGGLLFAAALGAAFLPPEFQRALLTYYLLTLGYSFVLRGIVLVDAIALAGLYTLRIIAGAVAVRVPLSFWMLLFSVFLFLSLAFAKRFAELEGLRRQNRLRAAGRGYETADLPSLQGLGSASGYVSVLVLALYINSPDIEALYRRPKAIWLLCVLMLAWISRVWMKAQRGEMHDDPVVFALKDRVSLVLGLLGVVVVGLSI